MMNGALGHGGTPKREAGKNRLEGDVRGWASWAGSCRFHTWPPRVIGLLRTEAPGAGSRCAVVDPSGPYQGRESHR